MHKKGLQRKAFFTLTNEGFSVHTFELSRQYTHRSWSAIKDRLYRELEQREPGEQAWIYAVSKKRNRYQCTRYVRHGVRIELEHNTSTAGPETFFIRMTINPRKLLEPESSYLGILPPTKDAAEAVAKAFRKLLKHTPFDCELDDYYLTRVDLCANLQCDNGKIFREVIRASQKLPAPPKMQRHYYQNPDPKKERRYNKHYIEYACNSYDLVLYDKTFQLTEEGLKLSYEKLPEGVLRCELRLRRDWIRSNQKMVGQESTVVYLQHLITKAKPFLLYINKKYSARQISSAAGAPGEHLVVSLPGAHPLPDAETGNSDPQSRLRGCGFRENAGKQGGAQGSAPSVPAPGRKSDSSPQELFR